MRNQNNIFICLVLVLFGCFASKNIKIDCSRLDYHFAEHYKYNRMSEYIKYNLSNELEFNNTPVNNDFKKLNISCVNESGINYESKQISISISKSELKLNTLSNIKIDTLFDLSNLIVSEINNKKVKKSLEYNDEYISMLSSFDVTINKKHIDLPINELSGYVNLSICEQFKNQYNVKVFFNKKTKLLYIYMFDIEYVNNCLPEIICYPSVVKFIFNSKKYLGSIYVDASVLSAYNAKNCKIEEEF